MAHSAVVFKSMSLYLWMRREHHYMIFFSHKEDENTINDLKVCEDGILTQLLCFWAPFIILFLFKTHNILETGLCLHHQIQSVELVPISQEKLCVLNKTG